MTTTYDPVTGTETFHGARRGNPAWAVPAPGVIATVRTTVRCLDCDRRARPNPECPDALCVDCLDALTKEGAR